MGTIFCPVCGREAEAYKNGELNSGSLRTKLNDVLYRPSYCSSCGISFHVSPWTRGLRSLMRWSGFSSKRKRCSSTAYRTANASTAHEYYIQSAFVPSRETKLNSSRISEPKSGADTAIASDNHRGHFHFSIKLPFMGVDFRVNFGELKTMPALPPANPQSKETAVFEATPVEADQLNSTDTAPHRSLAGGGWLRLVADRNNWKIR